MAPAVLWSTTPPSPLDSYFQRFPLVFDEAARFDYLRGRNPGKNNEFGRIPSTFSACSQPQHAWG